MQRASRYQKKVASFDLQKRNEHLFKKIQQIHLVSLTQPFNLTTCRILSVWSRTQSGPSRVYHPLHRNNPKKSKQLTAKECKKLNLTAITSNWPTLCSIRNRSLKRIGK